MSETDLARSRSPIGLDLGASTPEETALSSAAEIVATRRSGTGVPLTSSKTPIHRDTDTLTLPVRQRIAERLCEVVRDIWHKDAATPRLTC